MAKLCQVRIATGISFLLKEPIVAGSSTLTYQHFNRYIYPIFNHLLHDYETASKPDVISKFNPLEQFETLREVKYKNSYKDKFYICLNEQGAVIMTLLYYLSSISKE